MESRRWVNPTQPQTLQIAVLLLYFNAAIIVIFGGLLNPLGLLLAVGGFAGGFGIANEQKWGYAVGVAIAILPIALILLGRVGTPDVITLLFEIALLALLLHPQSRDYQRIWFK
jgi:hypothetical protein